VTTLLASGHLPDPRILAAMVLVPLVVLLVDLVLTVRALAGGPRSPGAAMFCFVWSAPQAAFSAYAAVMLWHQPADELIDYELVVRIALALFVWTASLAALALRARLRAPAAPAIR
jgi:hypothetical protein